MISSLEQFVPLNHSLSKQELVLYTIGYGNRSLKMFSNILINRNVEKIIDVRFNVFSENPDFNGQVKELELLFAGMGFEYEHRQELANPPEIRALFRTNRRVWRKAFFSRENFSALDRRTYQFIFTQQPTCLMCAEKRHKKCHRSDLARWIVKGANPKIKVVHL
jgi:uncharacterized protein (DUF488 family)